MALGMSGIIHRLSLTGEQWLSNIRQDMNVRPELEQSEQLLREFQMVDGQPAFELRQFIPLLEDFNRLPRTERTRQKTLLEIAGFPHREWVYSNILAFLLQPDEEHGLDDLVLRCLLEAAQGYDDVLKRLASSPAKGVVKVTREDRTEERKRIDLTVVTDSFVLGIENKIDAGPTNPFKEYKRYLDEIAAQSGKTVCRPILLNLKGEGDDEKLSGFRPVTYDELFSALRRNLGRSLTSSTSKHLFYLLDWMETLENLKHGVNMMDPSLIAFFKEHAEDAYRFHKRTDELRAELKWRGKQMKEVKLPSSALRLISEEDLSAGFCWNTYFEFDLGDGIHLGVQAWLNLAGWEISSYSYYDKGYEGGKGRLEKLMKANTGFLGQWKKDGEADLWVYKSYPYEEAEETVRNKFQELIDLVRDHLPPGLKAP